MPKIKNHLNLAHFLRHKHILALWTAHTDYHFSRTLPNGNLLVAWPSTRKVQYQDQMHHGVDPNQFAFDIINGKSPADAGRICTEFAITMTEIY